MRQIAETPQSRLCGAAVYNLYNVVTGRVQRFVNSVGADFLDLLAGLQLALEHGCSVMVDDAVYTGEYLHPGIKYRIDIRPCSQSGPEQEAKLVPCSCTSLS